MEAIQFNPVKQELNLVRKEKPKAPVGDQVLVKVAYSGICGTDLHIAEGAFPCKESVVTLGHEFSGVAEAVGPDVKHIRAGDKVAVDPNCPCHTCNFCTAGKYHLCQHAAINSTVGIFRDGGWAEYCVVPSSQVFKLPDGITLEQAALTEPLSCLAHGWDRINPVTVGQNILIQGCGIIGNLWAAALHLQGHKRVTVSEPQEPRRKLFENLGTGYKCVSPAELKGYQADLIIDCSGAAPAIEKAIDFLAPGGRLCIFGVASPQARVSISPYEIYKKEVTIIGVMINPFSFPNSLGLIEAMGTKYLDYNKLGVKTYSLQEYKSALDCLKKGTIAKAVFKIGK